MDSRAKKKQRENSGQGSFHDRPRFLFRERWIVALIRDSRS